MLVSVLLPTRNRVEQLHESLSSLDETVNVASQVEVIIKVDLDDIKTIDYLNAHRFKFNMGVLVGPRGRGYADLHLMYNKLCAVSTGTFLFLWNDDATMMTKDWDLELQRQNDGKVCYVTSKISDTRGRDSYLFPIVHRSYFEQCEHFSMSAHNDTYVYSVFKHWPNLFRDSNIVIKHSALQMLNDQTSLEAQQWWPTTKSTWDTPEVQKEIIADVVKLKELMKKQGYSELGWSI